MVFSSLMFMFVYLPIVLLIYYILPKKFRNFFLLVVDLFFYGWGEPVLVLLMVFSIVINWIAGILIGKTDSQKKKKLILILSVIIDLGMLGFFKYTGLITNTIKVIFPGADIPLLEIPLPIGISFYTFQIMSYTIDVYRGDTEVQKNIVSFGTYVSLFPQLIAGPIVRYSDVDKQLTERHENAEQFARGIRLFMLGLIRKVLFANSMGLLWDTMRETENGGVLTSWVGIIAYTLQIYYDFSGYSEMARGLGNMLGFEFVKNFDYPYISKSITEFWRRWHISLGTWFKEYVYIPLGGNKKGKPRQILNILIVWALTGIWHGASWNFLLWGAYFGVILILEKLLLLKTLDKLPSFVSHIYSLILIVFGWALFYFSDDVGGFKALAEFIPTLFTGGFVSADSLHNIIAFLPSLILGMICSTPIIRKIHDRFKDKKGFTVFEIIAIVAFLVICTASLASSDYNPFLYFKF